MASRGYRILRKTGFAEPVDYTAIVTRVQCGGAVVRRGRPGGWRALWFRAG
jgi:hypothetical protein